jgi:hypothetical protein
MTIQLFLLSPHISARTPDPTIHAEVNLDVLVDAQGVTLGTKVANCDVFAWELLGSVVGLLEIGE